MDEKKIYKLIKQKEAAIKENLLKSDELKDIEYKITDFLDDNLEKDSLLQLRHRRLKAGPRTLWCDIRGYTIDAWKYVEPLIDIFEQYLASKTIKKRLETEGFWVEARSRPSSGDEHILVGKRDKFGEKAHIIIGGKTGEIRVENSQKAPEEVLKNIKTILTLPNGRKIRNTREVLEEMPTEKEIKTEPERKPFVKLYIRNLKDYKKDKQQKIKDEGYLITRTVQKTINKRTYSAIEPSKYFFRIRNEGEGPALNVQVESDKFKIAKYQSNQLAPKKDEQSIKIIKKPNNKIRDLKELNGETFRIICDSEGKNQHQFNYKVIDTEKQQVEFIK